MKKFNEITPALRDKIVSVCGNEGNPETVYYEVLRYMYYGGTSIDFLAFFYEIEESLIGEIATENGLR